MNARAAEAEVHPDGRPRSPRAQRAAGRQRARIRQARSPQVTARGREAGRGADTPAENAAEALAAAEPVAIPSWRSLIGGLAPLLGEGSAVAREALGFGVEAARIAAGKSTLAPAPGDRRFADRTWSENPYYRRLAQLYVAWAKSVNRVVDGLEESNVDWHGIERARFASNILVSATAPSNGLLSNPAAMKRAFETGGKSVLRGVQNWVDDVRHNGGMPSQVSRGVFEVGRDLALSPGAVIDRDEVGELLQYQATTPAVRERPLLVVPPPIGRFYFLDLRPGRSFVEYAAGRGLSVFMLSWRNPGPEQGEWDLDTYSRRVLDAIETVRSVAETDDINVMGFCAGGILSTTTLNHLAYESRDLVHSMSYSVTLLDFDVPAPIGAFSSRPVLGLARGTSRRKGIIDARSMGSVFTWMRPDDLVFNYVVNNYLMGEKPPAFDILAWNADGTNLPAALHEQFLDIFASNTLCQPGRLSVLGSPVNLSRIKVPTFVTGAVTDHLTPWKGCYRTTQILRGPSTFILSNAGHIASLVNPPGNPKATYYAGGEPGPDPDAWLAGAQQHTGSWWEPWSEWVLERSGKEREAPTRLGNRQHRPQEPAPGLYVRDQLPSN